MSGIAFLMRRKANDAKKAAAAKADEPPSSVHETNNNFGGDGADFGGGGGSFSFMGDSFGGSSNNGFVGFGGDEQPPAASSGTPGAGFSMFKSRHKKTQPAPGDDCPLDHHEPQHEFSTQPPVAPVETPGAGLSMFQSRAKNIRPTHLEDSSPAAPPPNQNESQHGFSSQPSAVSTETPGAGFSMFQTRGKKTPAASTENIGAGLSMFQSRDKNTPPTQMEDSSPAAPPEHNESQQGFSTHPSATSTETLGAGFSMFQSRAKKAPVAPTETCGAGLSMFQSKAKNTRPNQMEDPSPAAPPPEHNESQHGVSSQPPAASAETPGAGFSMFKSRSKKTPPASSENSFSTTSILANSGGTNNAQPAAREKTPKAGFSMFKPRAKPAADARGEDSSAAKHNEYAKDEQRGFPFQRPVASADTPGAGLSMFKSRAKKAPGSSSDSSLLGPLRKHIECDKEANLSFSANPPPLPAGNPGTGLSMFQPRAKKTPASKTDSSLAGPPPRLSDYGNEAQYGYSAYPPVAPAETPGAGFPLFKSTYTTSQASGEDSSPTGSRPNQNHYANSDEHHGVAAPPPAETPGAGFSMFKSNNKQVAPAAFGGDPAADHTPNDNEFANNASAMSETAIGMNNDENHWDPSASATSDPSKTHFFNEEGYMETDGVDLNNAQPHAVEDLAIGQVEQPGLEKHGMNSLDSNGGRRLRKLNNPSNTNFDMSNIMDKMPPMKAHELENMPPPEDATTNEDIQNSTFTQERPTLPPKTPGIKGGGVRGLFAQRGVSFSLESDPNTAFGSEVRFGGVATPGGEAGVTAPKSVTPEDDPHGGALMPADLVHEADGHENGHALVGDRHQQPSDSDDFAIIGTELQFPGQSEFDVQQRFLSGDMNMPNNSNAMAVESHLIGTDAPPKPNNPMGPPLSRTKPMTQRKVQFADQASSGEPLQDMVEQFETVLRDASDKQQHVNDNLLEHTVELDIATADLIGCKTVAVDYMFELEDIKLELTKQIQKMNELTLDVPGIPQRDGGENP